MQTAEIGQEQEKKSLEWEAFVWYDGRAVMAAAGRSITRRSAPNMSLWFTSEWLT